MLQISVAYVPCNTLCRDKFYIKIDNDDFLDFYKKKKQKQKVYKRKINLKKFNLKRTAITRRVVMTCDDKICVTLRLYFLKKKS